MDVCVEIARVVVPTGCNFVKEGVRARGEMGSGMPRSKWTARLVLSYSVQLGLRQRFPWIFVCSVPIFALWNVRHPAKTTMYQSSPCQFPPGQRRPWEKNDWLLGFGAGEALEVMHAHNPEILLWGGGRKTWHTGEDRTGTVPISRLVPTGSTSNGIILPTWY